MSSSLDVVVHTSEGHGLLEDVREDETHGSSLLVPLNSGHECAAENPSRVERVTDHGEAAALRFSTSISGELEVCAQSDEN